MFSGSIKKFFKLKNYKIKKINKNLKKNKNF